MPSRRRDWLYHRRSRALAPRISSRCWQDESCRANIKALGRELLPKARRRVTIHEWVIPPARRPKKRVWRRLKTNERASRCWRAGVIVHAQCRIASRLDLLHGSVDFTRSQAPLKVLALVVDAFPPALAATSVPSLNDIQLSGSIKPMAALPAGWADKGWRVRPRGCP